jgi:hypothetical protein
MAWKSVAGSLRQSATDWTRNYDQSVHDWQAPQLTGVLRPEWLDGTLNVTRSCVYQYRKQ